MTNLYVFSMPTGPVACRKTISRDFGASCNLWTPQQTCPKILCQLGSFTLDLCRPKVVRHEGCLDVSLLNVMSHLFLYNSLIFTYFSVH